MSWQLPKRAAQRRPGVDRQPVVDIGQRARRHRIWRGHDAVREPKLPRLLAQPRLKLRPRPEQPQAALDTICALLGWVPMLVAVVMLVIAIFHSAQKQKIVVHVSPPLKIKKRFHLV